VLLIFVEFELMSILEELEFTPPMLDVWSTKLEDMLLEA